MIENIPQLKLPESESGTYDEFVSVYYAPIYRYIFRLVRGVSHRVILHRSSSAIVHNRRQCCTIAGNPAHRSSLRPESGILLKGSRVLRIRRSYGWEENRLYGYSQSAAPFADIVQCERDSARHRAQSPHHYALRRRRSISAPPAGWWTRRPASCGRPGRLS